MCEVERLRKRFPAICLHFVITFVVFVSVSVNSIYLKARLESNSAFPNIYHLVAALKTIAKAIQKTVHIKHRLLCTIKKLFWTLWSGNDTTKNKAYRCNLEFMRRHRDGYLLYKSVYCRCIT